MDRGAISRGLGTEELPPEISAEIGDEETSPLLGMSIGLCMTYRTLGSRTLN